MKNLSQMFLLALGFILFATTAQSEIKPKMTQFEALMKQLSPYLMSEKEYSNPDNYKKVEAILKEINVNLTELMKDPAVLGSNYKFRFKVLADGFKDVEQSYQNRFLDYSFWNLKSQLYQCSSCHTEKQMVDRWYSAELANHSDLFAQADFQFMLRGYEGCREVSKID